MAEDPDAYGFEADTSFLDLLDEWCGGGEPRGQ
jgi:hypothetical protein